MQDFASDQTLAAPAAEPAQATSLPPRRRGLRGIVAVVLLAFVGGIALTGWLFAEGKLDFALRYLGHRTADPQLVAAASGPGAVAPSAPQPATEAETAPEAPTLGSVETRLALLEERLSRIDAQADAATGNAARAEGLLVAFATRRLLEKGEPLGFLEGQLRLRFANAQPRAVRVVLDFAQAPITRDELVGELDALGPALAAKATDATLWSRMRDEVSSLFIVRRDASRPNAPEERLAHARLLLTSGKVDEAIEEVSHMPGARSASGWIARARAYATALDALDLIETAAMLEPRRLNEGEGRTIDQPSPLAAPASEAAPPPAAIKP